jgi:hypothetical protein
VTTYEVHAVIPHETISVAYCVDGGGTEVAVAIERPVADDLRRELEAGRHPRVLAEDWQILIGHPGPLQLR